MLGIRIDACNVAFDFESRILEMTKAEDTKDSTTPQKVRLSNWR
jgi:hypothetical protein